MARQQRTATGANQGLTHPNSFKARYQGKPFSGNSGIVHWANNIGVNQSFTDLGPNTGRHAYLLGAFQHGIPF